MIKKDLIIIWAYVFLFLQIPALILVWFYFGLEPNNSLIINLIWGVGIICGYYSHWVQKFMKNPMDR